MVLAAKPSHQVNLVFHQCNQWGYKNGNSFAHQRG